MVHLIVVIMGIALMSYLLVSGISYMNPSSYESKEKFERWSVLNLNLAIAWSRYSELNGKNPPNVDALKTTLSVTALIPDDMRLSALTADFPGWCFEGSVSQGGLESIKALASKYPDQYGLSASCGTTGGVDSTWTAPANPAEYPAPVIITYRFSR